MNIYYRSFFIMLVIFSFYEKSFAIDKVAAGSISCSANWNELCEDKKIISVPEHYRLCQHNLTVVEKSGDTSFQVVGSDNTSITVYFRAKGNLDRFHPQGASVNLSVDLYGVRENESCGNDNEAAVPTSPAVKPTPTPAENLQETNDTSSPVTEESKTAANASPHACACSQWLNWMKVQHCLEKGKTREGPNCDAYGASIECVESHDECRAIQHSSCPEVAGLNQSTSTKRLFVENSPYCKQ